MEDVQWILCPQCEHKTRIKIREDTVLEKLSAVLPEMQTGNANQCTKNEYGCYQRARR